MSITAFLWKEIPCAVNEVPLCEPIPFTFSNPTWNSKEFLSVSWITVLLVRSFTFTLLVTSTSIEGVFANPNVAFDIATDSISLVE